MFAWLLLLQVQEHITKMAKKGLTPSQIGVLLRDQHGIPQVHTINNSKILRIMKGLGLAPAIPEDLYYLIKKAVSMRKHLEANRKDKDSKFRLILVESRIHRLARYYKVRPSPCVFKGQHDLSRSQLVHRPSNSSRSEQSATQSHSFTNAKLSIFCLGIYSSFWILLCLTGDAVQACTMCLFQN